MNGGSAPSPSSSSASPHRERLAARAVHAPDETVSERPDAGAGLAPLSPPEPMQREQAPLCRPGEVWWACGRPVRRLTVLASFIAVMVVFLVFFCIRLAVFNWHAQGAPPPRPAAKPRVDPSRVELCQKPGCLRLAAATLPLLNRSVDPCTDFFHHACGGFDEAHPSGALTSTGMEDLLLRRNRQQTLNLLRESRMFNGSSAVSKARFIFATCMREFHRSTNRVTQLLRLLRPFGGLDLLGTWSPDGWDFNEVLLRMTTEHLAQPFFTMGWWRDQKTVHLEIPRFAMELTRHLEPGESLYEERKGYVRRGLRLVLQQLERDAVGDDPAANASRRCGKKCLKEMVDDIVSVEASLVAAMPHEWDRELDPTSPWTSHEWASMHELPIVAPTIDWRRLLDAVFGPGVISKRNTFLLPSRQYLASVDRLIANTKVKRMHHFLMWSVIRRYLIAMGPTYDVLDRMFDAYFYNAEVPTREMRCLRLLERHLTPALHAILLRGHIGEAKVPAARAFVRKLLAPLDKSFGEEADKMKHLEGERERGLLYGTTIHLGFSDLVTDGAALDRFYANLTIGGRTPFLDMLRELFGYVGRPGQLALRLDDSARARPEEVAVKYVLVDRRLSVPFGALQVPWYHPDVPDSLNAAALGSLVYSEMAVPYMTLHDTDNLTDIFGKRSTSVFDGFRHCVQNLFGEPIKLELHMISHGADGEILRKVPYQATIRPGLSTQTVVSEFFSYQLAYHVYQTLEARGPRSALPGMNLTDPSQAFYLAFAQTRCHNDFPPWSNDFKRTLLPKSYIVNTLVHNDPGFRRAFRCPQAPPPAKGAHPGRCPLKWLPGMGDDSHYKGDSDIIDFLLNRRSVEQQNARHVPKVR